MTAPRNCSAATATRRSTTGGRTAARIRHRSARCCCRARTGETVSSELDWFFRRDGSMFPVSYVSVPIDLPEGRGAVVAFNDIEDATPRRAAAARARGRADEQQAALRQVAALVAGDAAVGRRVRARSPARSAQLSADASGADVPLRARRDRDGDRGLERAPASIPGRHALAARRADDLHDRARDGPTGAGSTT